MRKDLKDKLEGGTFGEVSASHSGRMRSVKATGNKSTEARMRAMLVRAGVRGWRNQPRGLLGRPDFLFPEAKVVAFVDGCYWHGCPCSARAPKTNGAYWSAKIEGNRRRDREVARGLEEAGYRVFRVWEHELTGPPEWLDRLRAMIAERPEEGRAR